MTTKLEHALALAEQGFYVFRLRRNAKLPAEAGWQQEATTDPDEIRELFKDREYNIGIFTGRYGRDKGMTALAVIDVDTKQGKQGETTMRGLDALGFDLPPTLTVTTASGGRHHIYWNEYALSGGANKVGVNVDLKSHGGYIVAAGSIIDGTPYTPANNLEPAHAPQWLIDRGGRPTDKSAMLEPAASVLDTPQSVDRAIAYLKNTATPAVQGAGGNDRTYKTIAAVRDFGISEPMALELVFDHYSPRCSPPWHIDELQVVVGNAYRFAQNAIGALSAHNGSLSSIPDDPKDKDNTQNKKQLHYVLFKDATADVNDIPPLIKHYLDQDAVSILYGDSNTGKTFVALDMAYHVAAGLPWNTHKTTQGGVAYLAAEGGRSALLRLEALKIKYGNAEIPLALIPCQVNLFDSNTDFKDFINLIQEIERAVEPVRLIVIDTLSRAMHGGNENDSQDMGEFVKNVTFIKEHFHCHVLIVHHSGKDAARGARGHSLLRAAVDTELEIADFLITTTKQRDREFAKPQGFELETHTLRTDADGESITSCTVNYVDADARSSFENANRFEPRDSIAYQALQNCKTDRVLGQHENVVEYKEWAQCCKDFNISLVPGAVPWPKSEEGFRKAFRRVRDRLEGFGHVLEVADKQYVILKAGQAVP